MKILAILLIAGAVFVFRPTAEAHQFFKLDRAAALPTAQVEQVSIPEPTPLRTAENASESKPPEPVVQAVAPTPVTCNENQWVRADNGQCIDKPARAAAPAASYGVGSCEAEIAKYNWGYSTAVAVARAESGLNPGIVNNNPSTGDYSVGCFQINIYGANARTRPSEAELKNAATNVAWAYKIYSGNGQSFIGQWGVCRSKVSCY